ncbi:proline dehydrogenase family protein [Cohnella algarum]|uniref:proline dehydrogenase family protein n=1 Tax=Cohnella algarum TaxID=2044859 RepID=UPI001968737B|nr:proline dehydrogenase family protein [Cohnella algarum]MBN2983083.1 proline dehydrogenase family protein [Cohnella algarum]
MRVGDLFRTMGKSRLANRAARKYGLRFGASRFVAGETVSAAIEAVRRLNASGIAATLDHLGEFVAGEQEARLSADAVLRTLDAIAEAGIDSNVSVKLTSLGLDVDFGACESHMRRILERAARYGNFVRIDMEDYAHCQPAIEMYRKLGRDYDNVGIVIQAYLYRSERDVKELREVGANLRLVKGAYKETADVAYPDKKDVDANFKNLIRKQLLGGGYAAIATHDEDAVEYAKRLVREYGVSGDRFEFQMLYGIGEPLQRRLVREGYKVRVYVPYGIDWFGYFMRRLAERPANVRFVWDHLFKG